MKKKLITLVLASIVLTGDADPHPRCFLTVYMAKLQPLMTQLPEQQMECRASFSKSASADFNAGCRGGLCY